MKKPIGITDKTKISCKKRDIEHYKLLLKIFPNFNETSKTFKFWFRHCGISILLHLKNHKIVNDYHKTDKIFENWKKYK